VFFQIHEVYYNDQNIPTGYTENGARIISEDFKGLEWTLNNMLECLKKPVLWAGEKFPQEYENNK
jgi:hypothetical protein